jgi:predicted transcriptional regulator
VESNVACLVLNNIKLKKILISCLLFFLLTSIVEATEYIITPCTNDEPGVSVNGEKVVELRDFTNYWELLLWLFITNALSSIDVLFHSTKIIYIVTGFRIANNTNILQNSSRSTIYFYIENKPGAYFSEVVENTGLNRGTVKYHLKILEIKNKIEAYEDGGKTRYFQNNSKYTNEEKKVIVTLQNNTNQRIISEILNGRCNTNTSLAREFRVSRATINWYVKNLKETELINETKKGRNIIYEVSTSHKTLIKKYMSIFTQNHEEIK